MRFSLILLVFFVLGSVVGYFGLISIPSVYTSSFEDYLLYVLLFLVGISVGSDTKAIQGLFKVNLVIILIPIMVAIGSIGGAGFGSLFVRIPDLRECMAVGAGFGYYSLSSVIIGKLRGEAIGGIALMSNIFREVTTLLLAPVMCRYIARLAPIASGGATSMDTTLGVIYRYSGKDYAVIAVINGAILSILVPILVPLILS